MRGDTATVDFDYTEGGYDINPSTGAALETPDSAGAGPRHRDPEARRRALARGFVRVAPMRRFVALALAAIVLAATSGRQGRSAEASRSPSPTGHRLTAMRSLAFKRMANGRRPRARAIARCGSSKPSSLPTSGCTGFGSTRTAALARRSTSPTRLRWSRPRVKPGMGIHANTSAGMSLYLDVSVQPQDAPAESQRTVSAQLTAGWLNALNGAIQAYVVPSSVKVTTWTVDFGDGSRKTFPPDPSNPFGLTTTHTYGSGQFDVAVIAHVTGEAYGAFFAPNGTPYEAARSLRAQHQQQRERHRGADRVHPAGRDRHRQPIGNAARRHAHPRRRRRADPSVLAARAPLLALPAGRHRARRDTSSRAAL